MTSTTRWSVLGCGLLLGVLTCMFFWADSPLPRTAEGKTPAVEVGEQKLAVGARVARAAAERLAIWSSLKELTGVVSPFTTQIRAALEQELEAEQRKALEELQAEHEAAIAGVRSGADQEMLARLTDRLMTLSSLAPRSPEKGNGA